jgi:hypothetical protein
MMAGNAFAAKRAETPAVLARGGQNRACRGRHPIRLRDSIPIQLLLQRLHLPRRLLGGLTSAQQFGLQAHETLVRKR